jgi:hypothetical protein
VAYLQRLGHQQSPFEPTRHRDGEEGVEVSQVVETEVAQ